MQTSILAGVAVYMIAMLAVGFWASRRIHNLTDFLVAGRRLPFGLALATLFATWFGAGTCMGASGTAYSEGILGVIADPFAAGVSLILAGFFYVGLLRRLKLLTVTDIFGRYYSRGSEIMASLLMVPVYIGWLGAQMVALGYIVNLLTGMNTTLSIVLATAVVITYTSSGGMWAVTLTDFIQVIVLVAGLFILLPVTLQAAGGLETILKQTPPETWYFYPHQGSYQDWMSYAGQWALLGLGTVVGQDLVQRSLASKNEKVAVTSALSAGVLYILIGMIPVLLGLAGRFLFSEIADPEMIMPELALRYLPPLGVVLFLGALLSAIMSSADSSLLAASSLVSRNILRPLTGIDDDATVLKWTRTATVAVAVLAMVVALYVRQIYDLMVNSWATLFVALLVPVTAALYWKKANYLAAWASMIGGTGTWITLILIHAGSLTSISDPVFYEAAVYGGLASLAAYLAVTFLFYHFVEPIEPAVTLPAGED